MEQPLRARGLPSMALCALLAAGCGGNTTNEDVVAGTSSPTAAPTGAPTTVAPPQSYSNYAEFAKGQHKEAPKTKEAPKSQPSDKPAPAGASK